VERVGFSDKALLLALLNGGLAFGALVRLGVRPSVGVIDVVAA